VEPVAVDVVVVGAGFAGLVAAVRAQELGARVALLEKTPVAPSWSNSRLSGGSFSAAGISPLAPTDEIVAKLLRETEGAASEPLARAWAAACPRVYGWLRERGTRFVRLRDQLVIAPIRPNRRGSRWLGRGPDVTLRRLQARFVALGGQSWGNTIACELRQEQGRVVGLAARRLETDARVDFATRAVVLADGGFQANPALLRRYANVARPERLFLRGAGTGGGDALLMALGAGATLAAGEAIFGHLLHADAVRNAQLCHFPFLDRIVNAALVVGPDGRRFADEGLGALAVANRVARLPDPAATWLVFDRRLWETVGRYNQAVPPNPNLLLAGARIEVADDAAALASKLGMLAGALAATLAEYNTAVGAGKGKALPVPRGGTAAPLGAPLVAVPLVVGITYTLGGPLIDAHAQVVDAQDRPIPGLYAAGLTAGGLAGGPRPATAGGIGTALPLGFLAGEWAARAAAERPTAS
jgi:fumarate reductase flavoprotein subunit